LNPRNNRRTARIEPEKSQEINGGEMRIERLGKVIGFSTTTPRASMLTNRRRRRAEVNQTDRFGPSITGMGLVPTEYQIRVLGMVEATASGHRCGVAVFKHIIREFAFCYGLLVTLNGHSQAALCTPSLGRERKSASVSNSLSFRISFRI
jgi:hypothetical protein